MKTKLFFSAIFLMIFATTTIASSPKKVFSMIDSYGRTLTMPLIIEPAVEDSLPFDLQEVFTEVRLQSVNNNIDISEMIKPEHEVNDMPEMLSENNK